MISELQFNHQGLIPAIAQDYKDGTVLMMAWMNQEAFIKTLETKMATYFSRSRNQLWIKGQESGNKQKVVEVRIDCDADTVLLKVQQTGVACHTGDKTCFDGVLVWSAKQHMDYYKIGETNPSLADFKGFAETRKVIPVVRRLIGDSFTPVGLYKALAKEKPGTFLLESA